MQQKASSSHISQKESAVQVIFFHSLIKFTFVSYKMPFIAVFFPSFSSNMHERFYFYFPSAMKEIYAAWTRFSPLFLWNFSRTHVNIKCKQEGSSGNKTTSHLHNVNARLREHFKFNQWRDKKSFCAKKTFLYAKKVHQIGLGMTRDGGRKTEKNFRESLKRCR